MTRGPVVSWTDAEDNILRQNTHLPLRSVFERLVDAGYCRTIWSVDRRAQKLGVKFHNPQAERHFTPLELAFIQALTDEGRGCGHIAREVSVQFGKARTRNSIVRLWADKKVTRDRTARDSAKIVLAQKYAAIREAIKTKSLTEVSVLFGLSRSRVSEITDPKEARPKKEPQSTLPFQSRLWIEEPAPSGKPLLELEHDQCRWPMGLDRTGRAQLFCADVVATAGPFKSYCPIHCVMATAPARRAYIETPHLIAAE